MKFSCYTKLHIWMRWNVSKWKKKINKWYSLLLFFPSTIQNSWILTLWWKIYCLLCSSVFSHILAIYFCCLLVGKYLKPEKKDTKNEIKLIWNIIKLNLILLFWLAVETQFHKQNTFIVELNAHIYSTQKKNSRNFQHFRR